MGVAIFLVLHTDRRSEKRPEAHHKDLPKDKGKSDPKRSWENLQEQFTEEQDRGLLHDFIRVRQE